MNARTGARRKPPFWARQRLGWVNAAGFALTLFLGIWLLLALFGNLVPGADPIEFTISPAFILVLSVTQIATVALGAVLVFVFMWRGADFSSKRPRCFVFYWTASGVLFYLVQMVVLVRFGFIDLPNAASWAEHVYWGAAPIGLAVFGLMAYVNIDMPVEDDYDGGYDDEYDDDYADYEYAEHEDEA